MSAAIAEPQKELRFTRSAQAAVFGMAGSVCIVAGIVFFLGIFYRREFPDLPHPAWGWLPFLAGLGFLRLAFHCVKHAYLILTPLGLEIFPFFRPATGMQLIPWAQVVASDVDDRRLTLHFSAEKTSGIHLSLAPIRRTGRELLARAIRGRMNLEKAH